MDRISLDRRTLLSRVALGLTVPLASGLLLAPEPAGAVAISISGKVDADGGVLNIRSGPSTARPIVHEEPHGASLRLLQTSGDWFKVQASGRTGWAHSAYVFVNGTPSKMLHTGIRTRPRVALTFDAANDDYLATKVLDLLVQYRVKGSFGLTGSWAKRHPAHLQRMVNEGHQLINHGLNHLSFTGFSTGAAPLSPARRIAQLVATEEAFISVAGSGAGAYWRPPYSDYDDAALREAGAIKLSRCAMYDIDSLGWNGLSAAQIRDRVLSRIENGSIVKFHIGDGAQDGNALEAIITSLRADGYQFGTVRQTVLPS